MSSIAFGKPNLEPSPNLNPSLDLNLISHRRHMDWFSFLPNEGLQFVRGSRRRSLPSPAPAHPSPSRLHALCQPSTGCVKPDPSHADTQPAPRSGAGQVPQDPASPLHCAFGPSAGRSAPQV